MRDREARMSDDVIPLPSPPSLEQAVRRYWELRRLDRAGGVAPGALALPLVEPQEPLEGHRPARWVPGQPHDPAAAPAELALDDVVRGRRHAPKSTTRRPAPTVATGAPGVASGTRVVARRA